MDNTKRQSILSYIMYGALCAFLLIAGYRAGEYRTLNQIRERGISRVIENSSQNSSGSVQPSNEQKQILNTNDKNVDFGIFWEAWDIFEKRFVDRAKLDTKKMFYSAVKGLISSAEDPYTFFLSLIHI